MATLTLALVRCYAPSCITRRAAYAYVLFSAEAIVHKVENLRSGNVPFVGRKTDAAIARVSWRAEGPFQVQLELTVGGLVVGIRSAEKLEFVEAVAAGRLEMEAELMLEPAQ